jgi:adenylate cyclase
MDAEASGEARLRRIQRNTWLLPVAANLLVASTFFVGVVAWFPVHFSGLRLAPLLTSTMLAASVVFPAASITTRLVTRRRLRAAVAWIGEARRPSSEEVARLAAIPRRIALHGAVWWATAPLWATPLVHVQGYRFTPLVWLKVIVAWALIGVSGATLSYLVTERTLRPLRAMALAGDFVTEDVPPTMGMLSRLALAWLAAAGLPLITIALFLVGTDATERARSAPMIWYTCAIGLAVGVAITVFSARAITEPIQRVRAGLHTVGKGDLDTGMAVDETGELGLLQAGFNQMVTGLRDRERMRDLFGRHVGVEVARRALEHDHGLGGELCQASAMFVDVIASTHLAQTRSPDEVVAILNAFFDAVVRTVSDEGGFVNKFAGDGAMCVFGAPSEQSDHADRALRAASALHEKLAGLDGIEAAIGLSSGAVVAGNVGALDRYEFTIIGDPVNEAARLTEEAKLREPHVLASEKTIGCAGPAADDWTTAGSIWLRGREEPTAAFRPT